MGDRSARSVERLLQYVLVLRCQAGDPEAFAQLYAAHQERLRSYVVHLVGGADVEDVLQDVWLTVYRKISHVTDPGSIRAWLLRIARTRALDTLRQAKRRDLILQAAAREAPPSHVPGFRTDEIRTELAEVMGELTVEHREVLQLRFVEDLPYGDIAAVIGCPIGTVRSRLHHAKAALREVLGRRGVTHSRR